MAEVARSFVQNDGRAALAAFKRDTGEYPSTEEGLDALLKSPAGKAAKWKGPYLKEVPLDPWRQTYVYRQPGTHSPTGYDLFSKGADGTSDTIDDIGNW